MPAGYLGPVRVSEASGGKLVRDRIPDIIRSGGGDPHLETAPADALVDLLIAKLHEEVEEYADSREVEELADIIEVCFAAAAHAGISRGELLGLADTKRTERGGFDRALVWLGNRNTGE